jgi:hypothetical protein
MLICTRYPYDLGQDALPAAFVVLAPSHVLLLLILPLQNRFEEMVRQAMQATSAFSLIVSNPSPPIPSCLWSLNSVIPSALLRPPAEAASPLHRDLERPPQSQDSQTRSPLFPSFSVFSNTEGSRKERICLNFPAHRRQDLPRHSGVGGTRVVGFLIG